VTLSEVLQQVVQEHKGFLDNGTLELTSVSIRPFHHGLLGEKARDVHWGTRPSAPDDAPGPKHSPEYIEEYSIYYDTGGPLRSRTGTVGDLAKEGLPRFVVFTRFEKIDVYDYDVESGLDARNIPPDTLTAIVFQRK